MVRSSTHSAFVVRLTAVADPAYIAGSVEHVSSGSTARFEAIEELDAFMPEIMGQRQGEAAREQQGDES
jgi:hypothetical protein